MQFARRLPRSIGALALLAPCLGACGGSASSADATSPDSAATGVSAGIDANPGVVKPAIAADATWQWQLTGEVDTSYDVSAYDIDLFDTADDFIDELHRDGRVVICYFSAGSHEDWREDASAFPDDAIGEPLDGWEGERWLDVRDITVRNVLEARLELAASKGCDAVEPDNVTAFENETGFPIDADEQLDFNRFLAAAAHRHGLLIGLKNDLSQIADLVASFDFAVNEECHQYNECESYEPFIAAGKAVLNAEYADGFASDPTALCNEADRWGTQTLVLPLDLDNSFRIACD